MWISHIQLSQEGKGKRAKYVPIMILHHDHCSLDSRNCTCNYEVRSCQHLASNDMKIALAKARALAKRAQVYFHDARPGQAG
jgi:hypothetical protein